MEAFIKSRVSQSTRKSYRIGIKAFEKFYGKSAKSLLKEEDPSKIIENFYVECRQHSPQNTCRVKVNPIIQWCKYNNIQLNIRKSLGIYRSEITTRDHILQVEQARDMYKVGSLSEKIMVKTWLLGLRISDASRLEWRKFDVTPTDELIEVQLLTQKEGVVAHCFLDLEFQKLLKQHLPNLKQDNPFLFQSERSGRLSEKQLLRRLQKLASKAGVKVKGTFGWHVARKLFMRVCAENGVVSWNARLMCGKAVSKDILTYLNGVSLKKDATKVSHVLRMEETPQQTAKGEEYIEAMLEALRSLLKAKLQEQGLMFTTKETNWEELYEKLLPEKQRKERVQF